MRKPFELSCALLLPFSPSCGRILGKGGAKVRVVIVDVRALEAHADKHKVREAFEQLGWSAEIIANNATTLVPKIEIDGYRFTWWENHEPPYPDIPDTCTVSDY